MTLKEAFEILNNWEFDVRQPGMYRVVQAMTVLTCALYVSRERVEQVWRGCQECKPRCGLCVHMGAWDKHGKPHICERCEDFSNFESDQRFCEVCGAPMTDEAVDIVLRRLEAMQNETG